MKKSYRELNEKLIVLFFMALSTILHVVFLIQFHKTPYASILMVDAEGYHFKALALLTEGWIGESVFYQAPFYPYFLALAYKFFEPSVLLIQVIQSTLSVLTVGLTYEITRRVFDYKSANVAAALTVFTGVYLHFSGLLLKVTFSLFFVCLMLLMLIQAIRELNYVKWLFAGVLLGFNITLRGNFLIMIPGFLFWILFFPKEVSISIKMKRVIIFFMGALIILFPIALRNYFVSKDFVLITYQAGANFYIGNNFNANGRYSTIDFVRSNPEFEENDFRQRAESLSGRPLKPSEISRFWFQQSFKFIQEEPLRFLDLLGRKVLLSLNTYEIPDNYDFYFMKSNIPILKVGFVSFGILLFCALLGIFLGKLKTDEAWLLYIFLGFYSFSVVLFFVTSRYRIPIGPILTSFAGWFLVYGWDKIYQLNKGSLAKFFILSLLLGALIFRSEPYSDFSFSHWKLGIAFERKQMEVEAKKEYLSALTINPNYANAHLHLGLLYRRNKQPKKALIKFEQAVLNNPKLSEAWFQMGTLYYSNGSLEKARGAFEKGLALNPNVAEAHLNLGMIYNSLGNIDRAIFEHQTALKIKPVYPEVYFNLGRFFALQRKFYWSQYCYRKAKEQGYPVSDSIFQQLKKVIP